MIEIMTWQNKKKFEQEYGKLNLEEYIRPLELPKWSIKNFKSKCSKCIFFDTCCVADNIENCIDFYSVFEESDSNYYE